MHMMPSPYCAQERGRVGSVPGEQTGVRGGPPRTLQGRLLFLLDVPQIGVTAALINTNLRLASLLHCVTVGNCKVTRGMYEKVTEELLRGSSLTTVWQRLWLRS